jgi:hypothetical protein
MRRNSKQTQKYTNENKSNKQIQLKDNFYHNHAPKSHTNNLHYHTNTVCVKNITGKKNCDNSVARVNCQGFPKFDTRPHKAPRRLHGV